MTQRIHKPSGYQGHPPFVGMEVYDDNRTASWERYGNGNATFIAVYNQNSDWLEVQIMENGTKSSRRAFMTLESEASRALYQLLKDRYEPKAPIGDEPSTTA